LILLRLALLAITILIGVIAVVVGMAVTTSGLREGRVTMIFSNSGLSGSLIVDRGIDPSSYWRTLFLLGGLPMVAGAAASVAAWRAFRT
jgi:hypothetical protein